MTEQTLRAPTAALGLLSRADGSARFSLGATSVLAAVYGPAEPRLMRNELLDRAYVEVRKQQNSRPFWGKPTLLYLIYRASI